MPHTFKRHQTEIQSMAFVAKMHSGHPWEQARQLHREIMGRLELLRELTSPLAWWVAVWLWVTTPKAKRVRISRAKVKQAAEVKQELRDLWQARREAQKQLYGMQDPERDYWVSMCESKFWKEWACTGMVSLPTLEILLDMPDDWQADVLGRLGRRQDVFGQLTARIEMLHGHDETDCCATVGPDSFLVGLN